MPLLNTATKVYKGSSLASAIYKGSTKVWPPTVVSSGQIIRASYHSTFDTASHVVPLTPTSPGRTLVAVAASSNVILAPSGWTKTQMYIGAIEIASFVLPKASHTASKTSQTFSLNNGVGRAMVIVVIEDDITGNAFTTRQFYNDYAYPNWGTDVHTATAEIGLAVWVASYYVNSGPVVVDLSNYTSGFSEVADTGSATGTSFEHLRMWIASKDNVALSNQGAVATVSTNISGITEERRASILSYNRD